MAHRRVAAQRPLKLEDVPRISTTDTQAHRRVAAQRPLKPFGCRSSDCLCLRGASTCGRAEAIETMISPGDRSKPLSGAHRRVAAQRPLKQNVRTAPYAKGTER